MRFAAAHKVVTYSFAGLGLAALMLGTTFTLPEAVLVVVAFAASWFAESPLVDRPSYSRFWTVAAVVVLLAQIVRSLGGEALLTLGVQYAAFLQLSRLAHRRSAADYQQITILGFLHLIAGTVLSAGLDYGVVFFGFVIVMPWMLALTHLRRELELRYGVGSPRLRAELQSRELATPAFFGGTTLLALPLFLLTAALFFAFPRVGFGMLSTLGSRTQSIAGFGDDVELGGFGRIRDDPTVVVRVKIDRLPDPPPQSMNLRLRGTSFDRYAEGRWSRSQIAGKPVRRFDDEYVVHRRPQPDDHRYEVILDPMEEAVLFLPEGTVALEVPPVVRAGRNRYRKITRAPGLDLRYLRRFEGPLTYRAYADSKARAFAEPTIAKLQGRYLEVPPGYEQVSELAQAVAGDATPSIDKARRIEAFLRGGGGYRYTLEQPDTRGRDPLHVFLFEAKAGHCEYFSTAMAIMMRSLGFPARNVTGFLGADYNPYGAYYAVRNGNAHSWVEVLIDGKWTTFDPTPTSRSTSAVSSGFGAKLRQMMDALRVRWAEYVVEFNIRDQARALGGLLSWVRKLRQSDPKAVASSRDVLEARDDDFEVYFQPDWRWFIGTMSLFGIGVLIVRWNRKRRRATRAGRHLDPNKDRAVRLYVSLERSLRRAGEARPSDVTPAEHAKRLGAAGFAAAAEVEEVTEAYLAARFGDATMVPEEYRRLRHLSQSIPGRAKRAATG